MIRTAGRAVLPVVLAFCISAAAADDSVRVTFDNAGGNPGAAIASTGIAVRIEDEGERESFQIAAFVNDALRRSGLKPDSTAPAHLYLKFTRPRILSGRERPDIAVIGHGGSSSHARFGLEVEVPMDGKPAPLPPMSHRLAARLERGPGEVVWKAEAETDAVPGTGEQAALRRLAQAIVTTLAKGASRQ